jgi:hypothetical protein
LLGLISFDRLHTLRKLPAYVPIFIERSLFIAVGKPAFWIFLYLSISM